MKYLIIYSFISFHGTVSRGVISDLLYRYNLRNYWYYPMIWEISNICRDILYCRLFFIPVTNKIRKFQISSRYRANSRVRVMTRIMARILNIVIYYIAMVAAMG